MKIDLKNINYAISLDDEALWKFLIENNFNYLTGQTCVVSNVSDSTYGVVYNADDKLVFCKHKAMEINKNQKPPKVCTKIQKTCKIISNEEYEKHFRITNMTEIMILEMQEEKALFAPKAGGVLKT
jgi:hypothetical protein